MTCLNLMFKFTQLTFIYLFHVNCFSMIGIQEMGIPEAITHAIEQLPVGE